MIKKDKIQLVETLKDKFKKAKAVIFADFTGSKVNEIEELRNKLRENNLEYQVIKKSLLKRVFPEFDYQGPVAIALGDDDIMLSKILSSCTVIKILYGRDLTLEQIQELAKLPTQEESLVKFVHLLKNNLNKLILCLKNIKA